MTKALLRNGDDFKAIVGEEDSSSTNLHIRPYTISGLNVPEQLFDRIDKTRDAVQLLGRELGAVVGPRGFSDCTVFIDPIDGTREFSTKMGEQCTILVGFAVKGRPAAGVMYRPIPNPPSWAFGCKSEGIFESQLDMDGDVATTSSPINPHGLLTSNGSISPFLERLLEGLASQEDAKVFAEDEDKRDAADQMRVRAGGVGNKLMNLLEHKGMLYIQDRGVSRWDTCAPQAVIEARGGLLVKLSSLMASKKLESYTYEKTTENLDVNTDYPVQLGKYNRRAAATSKNDSFLDESQQVTDLRPYANVCGFLALDAASAAPERLDAITSMVQSAAVESEPTFS